MAHVEKNEVRKVTGKTTHTYVRSTHTVRISMAVISTIDHMGFRMNQLKYTNS